MTHSEGGSLALRAATALVRTAIEVVGLADWIGVDAMRASCAMSAESASLDLDTCVAPLGFAVCTGGEVAATHWRAGGIDAIEVSQREEQEAV